MLIFFGSMVSDFFFPQPGGVESHIYQLSTVCILSMIQCNILNNGRNSLIVVIK